MSSEADETKLAPHSGAGRTTSRRTGWLSPVDAERGDSIGPGALLAERYRIIGLLGRGGMGEVYRADDLRLGQEVALKFLPAGVADDATRLAQFHNEVRVARQISHRNVCRVYDIGEDAGRIFLTMEYVDGEDLAALLKRIGRFPADKGVAIARQICAGLAAAHERRVLHRDLKPANIMLDSEGRVRISDFGLAGLAEDVHDVRSGTPAYMAPEQLAGVEVSTKSDIFALGLVLYEIFTGRRAFEAKTVAELLRMHDRGPQETPTSVAGDLDPAIERVIRRCLDPDPANRPASPLAVSAGLPGGDPLAAALAAGETPSPEMVAAAGKRGAVRLPIALAGLSWALVGVLVFASAYHTLLVTGATPVDLPPQVLQNRAQVALRTLGYADAPIHSAGGFDQARDYLEYVTRTRSDAARWQELRTGRPPVVEYWYRTSPQPLVPSGFRGRLGPRDPPLELSGMTLVIVDAMGRLLELHALPPERDAQAGDPPEVDWSRLFALAEIDQRHFTQAAPEWVPFGFADRRAAWTGTLPEFGTTPIRLEAASYRGRPAFFTIVGPWSRPTRMQAPPRGALTDWLVTLTTVVVIGFVAVAVMLARRHVQSGRSDRQGARRLAVVMCLLGLGTWVLGGSHFRSLPVESGQFFIAAAFAVLQAGIAWVLYLAIEPLVRRYWPKGLITWTRVLAGDWWDPLVGRDVLVGVGCGVALALAGMGTEVLARFSTAAPPTPRGFNIDVLEGSRYFLAWVLRVVDSGIQSGVIATLVFAILRAWLRRTWLAAAVVLVLLTVATSPQVIAGNRPGAEIVTALAFVGIVVGTLVHLGLLALVTMFMVNLLLVSMPTSLNTSTWYAAVSLGPVIIVAALAIGAFIIARAGEPLFGKPLTD